jgi:hypothetical protein
MDASKQPISAVVLRRLSSGDRDAVLRAAAANAAHDYEMDRDLTAFEAFGADDIFLDPAD